MWKPEKHGMTDEMIIKLNPHERKVLRALGIYYSDFGYIGFSTIARKTHLNRKQVRRAARSLRRKGLADYCCGLFNDNGDVAGAGYGCTTKGAEVLGL